MLDPEIMSQHRIRGRLRVWFFKPLSVNVVNLIINHPKLEFIIAYIYIFIYTVYLYMSIWDNVKLPSNG